LTELFFVYQNISKYQEQLNFFIHVEAEKQIRVGNNLIIIPMKNVLLMALFVCSSFLSYSQEYHKVKVTLKNGLTMEGKHALITPDSVSFLTETDYTNIPLESVQFINAKKGKAQKFAGYAAGGCLGLSLGVLVASGGETTNLSTGKTETIDIGEYLLGTALWMAIFGGVGCLIGTLADDWNMVYMSSSQSSILKKTKLNFTADQKGGVMLKLRYSF
jgi:hypothetical protein